jgi:ribulose-phosphate 3-epimerase
MSRQAILETLRRSRPLIVPSMLKCDFGNLHREVELLESAGVEVLHWDVMDGHFVPNLSYGALVIEKVRPRTEMLFDAHLMISEPERYVQEYLDAGCQAVTVHVEAAPDPAPVLDRIRAGGCVAGLSLNPGTPVDRIEPFLDRCDLVLVMSVQPGFGGQAFQPQALDKVRRLRALAGEDLLLSIDGGVSPVTIGAAAEAGADLFVVGSAIFDTDDYSRAVRDLRTLAADNRPAALAEVRN